MTIENDDVENVDAIHVCKEGETSPGGKFHIASMDCWCEPTCYTHIEHPNAENPIGICLSPGCGSHRGAKEVRAGATLTPGSMVIGTPEEKQAREVPVRICMVKNSRHGGGRVARATCVYHGREILVEVPTRGEDDYVAIQLAFEEVKRQAQATTEDVMSGGTAWSQAFGRAKTWVRNLWGGA